MRRGLNSPIEPVSEDTLANMAITLWEAQQQLKKFVEKVNQMTNEENEALEKSILSGGHVKFVTDIYKTTHTAYSMEEYSKLKWRMSIPYTRRLFFDKEWSLVKTIEPMG